MAIANFLMEAGAWGWIVAGLVLLGLELVVPGGFLVWLGVAGIVTGALSYVVPMGWPVQWVIFGVLSLVTITAWLRFTRQRSASAQSDRPFLNRRADRFIGHEAVLEEAIVEGFGRIALGDTVWRVAGPELPVGQRVRIVGSDGAVLRVEAV